MEHTKHDLSYDHAELDYGALLKTARIAFHALLLNIEEHSSKCHSGDITCRYLEAGWLYQDAKELTIVAETLSTLEGGLTRSQIEIINKPKQEPDNGI